MAKKGKVRGSVFPVLDAIKFNKDANKPHKSSKKTVSFAKKKQPLPSAAEEQAKKVLHDFREKKLKVLKKKRKNIFLFDPLKEAHPVRESSLTKFGKKDANKFQKKKSIVTSSVKKKGIVGKRTEYTALLNKSKASLLSRSRTVPQSPERNKKESVKSKIIKGTGKEKQVTGSGEFLSGHAASRLVFMVRDPFWIYAYWEIAPDDIQSLKDKLSKEEIMEAKIILRMYDVTLVDFDGNNANFYFDIEVGHNSNNWYINLYKDGVSYVGEIGLRIPDGRFFFLARSNFVHTPRIGYSPRSEQIWMKVTDETQTPPYVVPRIKISKNGINPAESADFSKIKKRVIYLSEEDIRRYYGSLTPLLRDTILSSLNKQYDRKFRLGEYIFVLEGESRKERQQIISWLPKDYFVKKMLLGSSENIGFLGASEQLAKSRPTQEIL